MNAGLRLLILLIAAIVAIELLGGFRRLPRLPEVALPIAEPVFPVKPRKPPAPLSPQPRQAPTPPPQQVAELPPQPSVAALNVLPPPPPRLSERELYERYARAIIQIFCTTREDIFSASGVIVNERGLVLSNAHVAEVIEKAGAASCQARHGNPADTFAGIEIVFTATTTAKIPNTDVPQRDIAFLRLVAPREPFAAAPLALGVVGRGETLLTLGDPSEFLQGIITQAHSNLLFSSLGVDRYADVDGDFSTPEAYVFKGGLALQEGSSGTALFTPEGYVVALMFATTKGKTTAEREGVAFMTPYIDTVLKMETGQGLEEFITTH